MWPNNLKVYFVKPNKIFLKSRTDWSTYQSTYYSIYWIKMQLKTKKPSATGLHNNAWKNEKDIDMICWFGPKWDIISYLISPEFRGYYIISYIPPRDIISDIDMQRYTAGIGRMGLFSARLVHFFLCSIYGVKNEHQKNMPQLRRYVASSLVPLRPKVIKYGLRFLKWTIRNVSTLCQNLINFILNFQFEKKVP